MTSFSGDLQHQAIARSVLTRCDVNKRLGSLEPRAKKKKKKEDEGENEKEKQKMFEQNFAGLRGREAQWFARS